MQILIWKFRNCNASGSIVTSIDGGIVEEMYPLLNFKDIFFIDDAYNGAWNLC